MGAGYHHATISVPSTTTLTILHDDNDEESADFTSSTDVGKKVVEHRIATNILKQSQVVLYRDLGTPSSSSSALAVAQDFDVVTMCLAKIDQIQRKGGDFPSSIAGDSLVPFDVFSAAQVRWIRSALRAQFGGEAMRKCKSLLISGCTSLAPSSFVMSKPANSLDMQHKLGSKRSRSSTRGSSSVLADHFNFSATFPSKLLRFCPHVQHPTVIDIRLVVNIGDDEPGCGGSYLHVEIAANLSKDRWPTRIELIAPVSGMSSTTSLCGVGSQKHAMFSYSCPCTKRIGTEPTAIDPVGVDDVVCGGTELPTGSENAVRVYGDAHVEYMSGPPPLQAPLLAPSPHSIPTHNATVTPSSSPNKPPCRHALMLALWYISQSVGW
jgi:hypothetical protein